MLWLDRTLDELAAQPAIGYLRDGAIAGEPTAITALTLTVHDRLPHANHAAAALVKMQQPSGEIAVRAGESSPGWPTSLAIVAWSAVDRLAYKSAIDRAAVWLLEHRGKAIEQSAEFGHNSELVGWAYAENTHSWVEPTAFGVLALKAADKGDHPAARDGVAVLIDRQLPGGGLNYGNTYVLGQLIRPHVQPTGIALLALAGAVDRSDRIAKSAAWLRRNIGPDTTPQSLAWAVLGLRSSGAELPADVDDWLRAAAQRVEQRDRSPHKLALLALAAKGWPT